MVTYSNDDNDHVKMPLNDGYGNSDMHEGQAFTNIPQSAEVADFAESAQCPSPVSLIRFTGGVLLMSGCVVAFVGEVTQWLIVDCLQLVFLLLIAVIVAIVDAPPPWTGPFVKARQENVAKYCGAVFSITGRGLTLSFASSAVWCSLFTNVAGTTMLVLGGIASMAPFVIGIGAVVHGIYKGTTLHSAKARFIKANKPLNTCWPSNNDFIGKPEFNGMLNECAGCRFDNHDLTLIFRALSAKGNPNLISRNDVEQWLGSAFTML